MTFKPSAEQAPVIATRGQDILVSASAGSGKTAVLVERVMQLLQRDRLNIDQLLLVTFTKEAAKNMRDRLRQRLVVAKDAHLKEQVARLALANISTIHAFCEQIIKHYYYVIDLDPQYRLVADAEQGLLLDQAWQATATAWLAPQPVAQHAAFTALAANFATGTAGTGLEAVVRQVDQAANAQPDPQAWLTSLPAKYDLGTAEELTQAPWFTSLVGPVVARELRALIMEWQGLADRAPGIFTSRLTADLTLLQTAFQADGTLADWATLAAVTDQKAYGRNPTKPKEAVPAGFTTTAATRKALKKRLQDLHDRYFSLSPGRLRKLMPQAQQLMTTLVAVAKDFRRRYQIAKQQRHLLDYADLEHYAAAILSGTNINPLVTWDAERQAAKQRAAARVRQELQDRYREIMVDEYQDTNRLQDDLLHRLHDPARNHLFLVGDMKQSIYRFRQADPTLFAGYYRQFAQQDEAAAFDLSDNYRSQELITAFTNRIFSQLMDQNLGEMDYDQRAALTPKAQWGSDLKAPEVLVYQRDAAPAAANDLARLHQPETAKVGEIWLVGQRIQQMLDHETILDPTTRAPRPVTPGDIVILARTKGVNSAIVDQFAKLNLPVVVHGVENYLQATEIRVVMSLLRLVDNAAQDVPLVAVMRSPLIRVAPAAAAKFGLSAPGDRTGFNEPEMAALRTLAPTGDYYAAVRATYDRWRQAELTAAGIQPAQLTAPAPDTRALAAAVAQDPAGLAQQTIPGTTVNCGLLYLKLDRLFTLLASLGQVARQQPLVDLIWAIYQETGYLDYVGGMPGGPQRQANLHALYERASSYEETSFKGLYQFIHFIEQLQAKDDDLGVAPTELASDAINVMTIHGAKGLQFPVVFLIDTNHRFRTPGGTTVVAPQQGVGLTLQEPGPNPMARFKTSLPQYEAIKDQLIRNSRAEEMRLLYVALTRAEQRLIITAEQSPTDQRNQYKRWLPALTSGPVVATGCRLAARSMFDWLMQTLIRTPAFPAALLPAEVAITPPAGYQTAWVGQVANAQTVTTKLTAWTAPGSPAPATMPPAGTSRDFQALVNQVLTFNYPDPVATTTTAFQAVSTIRAAFARQDPADLEMGRLVIDQHQVREGGAYLGPDKTSLGTPAFIQAQAAAQRPSAATVGTATHLVFQQLDLTQGKVTAAQVATTIDQLLATSQIEGPAVARAIDQAGIVAFYQTPLGQQLLAQPATVHREAPFAMLIPAATLFKGLHDPQSDVLIHGIIDGYQEQAGRLALFDYKTDQVRSQAPDADLARLVAKYQGQLILYADALAKMTGRPLNQIDQQLYFVRARRLVSLGPTTVKDYLAQGGRPK